MRNDDECGVGVEGWGNPPERSAGGAEQGKWKRKSLSCVRLFVTPRTIQSMEFSRQEYRSG